MSVHSQPPKLLAVILRIVFAILDFIQRRSK